MIPVDPQPGPDGLWAIGQLGQSLDGRVATVTGASHYINGAPALDHLHRLRAAVDAVVVGVGTALADDPRLTVRRVVGQSPARVVIDPKGRLPASARLFDDDGLRRVVIGSHRRVVPPGVESVVLAADIEGRIAPAAIRAALVALGFRRVLIEGGAATVSAFLAARALERLHVLVAPLIIGSGLASVSLAPIADLALALRPPTAVHDLGAGEALFDLDLRV